MTDGNDLLLNGTEKTDIIKEWNDTVNLHVNDVWIGLVDLETTREKGNYAFFKYVKEIKQTSGSLDIFIEIPEWIAEMDQEEKDKAGVGR
ncbi:hypothetical protein [Methanolobus sp. WCC4]|uniref:hypothetical protein n=1 Tax=Methanolobus sp. WCC4 TaxID=3125784 RepID=UPI0030F9B819